MAIYACDLGGTRMKLGVVEDGKVLSKTTIDAHSDQGLAPQLPRISQALRRMSDAPMTGISIAFPSIIDPVKREVIADSGKYCDAMSIDLNAWAQSEFGLPLHLDNDARMAAIGEWQYGAGKGFSDLVMITLGTGIGTGVIIGDKVLRGKHGQAGCLGGHISVQVNGTVCACGNTGCAEAEASTFRLPEKVLKMTGSPERVKELSSYKAVFERALEGDADAIQLQREALDVWCTAAVNLIHAYDPEILIIGGGIMGSGPMILNAIQDYVDHHAWTPWGKVKILPSLLGDDAALLGGAYEG